MTHLSYLDIRPLLASWVIMPQEFSEPMESSILSYSRNYSLKLICAPALYLFIFLSVFTIWDHVCWCLRISLNSAQRSLPGVLSGSMWYWESTGTPPVKACTLVSWVLSQALFPILKGIERSREILQGLRWLALYVINPWFYLWHLSSSKHRQKWPLSTVISPEHHWVWPLTSKRNFFDGLFCLHILFSF